MKMKSTNTVRRNIRRKRIGKYLTKAVKNQTESSLENLASQANRQVYPAANRNLNRVVRVGFIIKREKKLSLSSRRNYETDHDKTLRYTASCLKKSIDGNCIVHRREAVERCDKLNLITLLPDCFHKKNTNDRCLHHDYVDTIFMYKILFFDNIMAALRGYVDGEVKFTDDMEQIVQQLLINYHQNTEAAAVIYVKFLRIYRNFINVEFDHINDYFLMETILLGTTYEPPNFSGNISQCIGIDLATGYRCDKNKSRGHSHCERHIVLHRFHKLFTHEGTGLRTNKDNDFSIFQNVSVYTCRG
ncbi:hypothetical protein HA402_001526 [Bradysia odoriphaga]|nr:hypothetical protein HA402_001526 [Bradysia odoriphaga]